MKYLLLFIACLFITNAFSNKIDLLKSDKDVADFIISLDSMFTRKHAQRFIVPTDSAIVQCSPMAKTAKIHNWEKTDFNNDGATDLLVIGNWYDYKPYVVIDIGNNQFKLIELGYSSFNNCELAKIITINKRPMLVFYVKKTYLDRTSKKIADYKDSTEIDTLAYQFNSFIEYNPHITKKKIKSITFKTGTCFGTCPEFSITVLANGKAIYSGGSFDKRDGQYSALIPRVDLQPIYDIIDYIDLKKIKNNYAVTWTDSPTCSLMINFKDGSVKNIEDYGELGTFGLRAVYDHFFQIHAKQYWEKAN